MEQQNKTLDLELGAEAILRAKVEYHKKQAKFHAQLAKDTQEKLDLLTSSTNTASITGVDNIVQMDADSFSLSEWKSKVVQALEKFSYPVTSMEILKSVDSSLIGNPYLKKKAIGVISNSLHFLVKNDRVQVVPHDGRGNKYVIKKPAHMSEAG